MKLFCRKAFKCDGIKSGYEKLSNDILSHAQGHPIAIKAFGSSLFSKDVPQWKDVLARLKQLESERYHENASNKL